MKRVEHNATLKAQASNDVKARKFTVPLRGLAALRILIILMIGLGYASTMALGPQTVELGRHWGYDPSWYGIQMLFILSGFLAARSMSRGRSIREFFTSRVRSLWPALIFATLISVFVIYPIMCAPDAAIRMSATDLTAYFLKTVFLVDPGGLMPGLLDDAKYMCLLQGAIWTLRWGLLLHIAFLIGWKTRLLQNPKILLALCVASIAAYVGIVDYAVSNAKFGSKVETFLPGLRLGYAYLIGVTLFSWQSSLRLNKRRILVSATAIAIMATGGHVWMPWSAVQEILGVAFWLTLCFGFLHNAPQFVRRCPKIAPMLYVSIWPTAQIVVALLPVRGQIGIIETSLILALMSAALMYLLFRQARIQPARL
jgi:peptidoglycan/LPS O-acetylase OafA/YrhL